MCEGIFPAVSFYGLEASLYRSRACPLGFVPEKSADVESVAREILLFETLGFQLILRAAKGKGGPEVFFVAFISARSDQVPN